MFFVGGGGNFCGKIEKSLALALMFEKRPGGNS